MYTEWILLLIVVAAIYFGQQLLSDREKSTSVGIEKDDPNAFTPRIAARMMLMLMLIIIICTMGLMVADTTMRLSAGKKSSESDSTRCTNDQICQRLDAIDKKLASGNPSTDSKTIKEILKKLDSLHKSLSVEDRADDEIDQSKEQPVSGGFSFLRTAGFIIILILILAALASLYMIIAKFDWKWVGTLTISSILSVSSILGFEMENLAGKLSLFERNNYFQGGGGVATARPAIDPKLTMTHLGDVHGFETGKFDRYNSRDLEDVVRKYGTDSSAVLIVIGEVDYRELNGDLKGRIGSNLTLARTRAEKVGEALERRLKSKLILTLSRGARHPGDAAALSADRKVSVYAMSIANEGAFQ